MLHYQEILTEIHSEIGAKGLVSMECKQVISQYGDLMWDLLISGVRLQIYLCLRSYSNMCGSGRLTGRDISCHLGVILTFICS